MYEEYNGLEERLYPRFSVGKNYIEIECGEKFGVADLKSNIIIPVQEYEWIVASDKIIFVKPYDEDWKFYVAENGHIEEIEYDDIRYEEDEFVAVKFNGHWEFADLT